MTMWTDDKVKRMAALFAQGWSARKISEDLGVTRNAVLGKAHRLGEALGPRSSKRGPKPQKFPPRRRPIYVAPQPIPPPPAPYTGPPRPCTILELQPGQCKWPVNDGRPHYYFCAEPVDGPREYCANHSKLARRMNGAA